MSQADLLDFEEYLAKSIQELMFYQPGSGNTLSLSHLNDKLRRESFPRELEDEVQGLLAHMPDSTAVWHDLTVLDDYRRFQLGQVLIEAFRTVVAYNAKNDDD